ncbi:MAG: hypothetical protein QOF53_1866 [Nocardioidaceae bacterium]|nr:hypothetical protein [Nocardioidaceae bacterium]
MVPFVGRQSERARLRTLFDQAGAGHAQVVFVQGPPGIGKTSLVEAFLNDASHAVPVPLVLRSSGEEAETTLLYGVVEQLVRSAGRRPRSASEAAAAAVRAAIAAPGGSSDDQVGDPVTVGTRFMELLDELSADNVVIVVDDAQWADRASLQTLVFVARRLFADRVLLLWMVREQDVLDLPDSLIRLQRRAESTVLRLSGLNDEDLGELAAAMGVGELDAAAVRRLRFGTQGNPLHARALLEEFPPARWGGDDQPLPPPREFRRLVQDRCAACAPATRALLEVAAVLGPHAPLPMAAALGELDDELLAVDEAAAHGLLHAVQSDSTWTLTFPHPLIGAAVYSAIGLARRRSLHLQAAALVADPAVALRHRVAAASGPDARIAADLTAFAEQLAARQDWQNATVQLMTASRLSPDPVAAGRAVLRAAVWSTLRGDAATARSLLDELSDFPPGPMRDVVAGAMAMAGETPARAQELLAAAWQRRPVDADPELTAIIALSNATHFYGRLNAEATVMWCERALEFSRQDSVRAVAGTYLVHGLGYAGRAEDSYLAAEAAQGRPGEASELWLNPRSARGVLRLVDDDLAGARADLESAAAAATRLGILNTAAFCFAYLARTEWVAGDWDDAVVHAERALAINLESAFGFMESAIAGIAVLVPAGRGDFAAAQDLVSTMSQHDAGYERSIVALGMARARLGEARGEPDLVLAGLEPVRRLPVRDGVDQPGFWSWPDLYADALVRTGRAAEADDFLVPHERAAARSGRRTSMARLARSRGGIEAARQRPDQADAAFRFALEVLGNLSVPFERARIEHAAGAFHRRAGQRRRAADLLQTARRRFSALGATPYLDRCDQELAASGVARSGLPAIDRAGLTTQEWVVARHAAAGRSNREIAGEMVVSVKTVEYHLRNAFVKLNVSSRRQLPARLAETT